MSRILRGDRVAAIDYFVPFGVAAIVTIACLAALARLLRREAIVFGR